MFDIGWPASRTTNTKHMKIKFTYPEHVCTSSEMIARAHRPLQSATSRMKFDRKSGIDGRKTGKAISPISNKRVIIP